MPSELPPARPVLTIDGVPDLPLSGLVRALRIDQAEDGVSRLELRMLNHVASADGQAGPVFGAAAPLRLGSLIGLAMGDAPAAPALFQGKVHLIEHVHAEGSVPEAVVRAADARQAPQTPAGADIPLGVGGSLLSARVIEGTSALRLDGVCTGNPAIRVGGVVAVQGLAPQLANRYRVSTVTHLHDPAQGYRTAFTGVSIATLQQP